MTTSESPEAHDRAHEPTPPTPSQQAHRHDPVYDRLAATTEFAELKSAYRRFVFPATAAFLVWYLLFVVMSNWAEGFMSTKVVGNINIALVFGLLQFVTTFVIAYLYSTYSNRHLDPLARHLDEEFVRSAGAPTPEHRREA